MSDRALGRLLVTGGAGFIGSCYVRDVLGRRDGTTITVLDKLTYAGVESNLDAVRADPELAARLRFVKGDIADQDVVGPLVAEADGIVNFAAESHVDRSILDPEAFLRTGVIGVHVLLEAVRAAAHRPRFLQVSTDEVYGSIDVGHATESAPLAPRSPYAAAKAAGELLVRSYVITHGIDAVTTRGSNTYGPHQHPEKLIPLFITNAIDDQPLPMYGDGLQRRDWLHVSDHADGVDFVLRHGIAGEVYNLAGGTEMTNRDTVALLLERLGKPWSLVRAVEDRPGHDRRYAMDGARVTALGWTPSRFVRGGPRGHRRLVSSQRSLVAGDPFRRLGCLLRAPVRTPPGGVDDRRCVARLRCVVGRRSVAGRLMRVAVTGASGRLGRPSSPPWPTRRSPAPPGRSPGTGPRSISMRRTGSAPGSIGIGRKSSCTPPPGPTWMACARDPQLAMTRNGQATDVLARACAERGLDLAIVSTNEVFGGSLAEGESYGPDATPDPINPYGTSKLAAERAAATAFESATGQLGIVRTAWLFGTPEADFPSRILAAAARSLDGGPPLRIVRDEWGTPTYTRDLAEAIVDLLAEDAIAGTHHIVNGGVTTRSGWARDTIDRAGLTVEIVEILASDWSRPSAVPPRAILAPTPLPYGAPLRAWPEAMADYAPTLLRAWRRTA